MAKLLLRLLLVALCSASAVTAFETSLIVGAGLGENQIEVKNSTGLERGEKMMLVTLTDPPEAEVYTIKSTYGLSVILVEKLTKQYAVGSRAILGSSWPTVTPVTTTLAGFDSSASSGSASLASSNSGFLHGWSSSSNSGSNPLNSASSGSTASGSWGSFLEFWQWLLMLLFCCCCFFAAAGAAATAKGKQVHEQTALQEAPVTTTTKPMSVDGSTQGSVNMQPLAPIYTVREDADTSPLVTSSKPEKKPLAPIFTKGEVSATAQTATLFTQTSNLVAMPSYQLAAPTYSSGGYYGAQPATTSYRMPSTMSYSAVQPTYAAAPTYATASYAQYR